ncbi:MAG: hypothetical protein ACYCRE_06595 [Acidobacteriaceae bacterium]
MCGTREEQKAMFSYVTLKRRIPQGHPLRRIRFLVDRTLERMDRQFDALYAKTGQASDAKASRELLAGLGPLPARCI